jgi:hypothetical protein
LLVLETCHPVAIWKGQPEYHNTDGCEDGTEQAAAAVE